MVSGLSSLWFTEDSERTIYFVLLYKEEPGKIEEDTFQNIKNGVPQKLKNFSSLQI